MFIPYCMLLFLYISFNSEMEQANQNSNLQPALVRPDRSRYTHIFTNLTLYIYLLLKIHV